MVEQQVVLGVTNKLCYLACDNAVRNPYAENVVSCHRFKLNQKSLKPEIAGSSLPATRCPLWWEAAQNQLRGYRPQIGASVVRAA
jgi:hypothetical protein